MTCGLDLLNPEDMPSHYSLCSCFFNASSYHCCLCSITIPLSSHRMFYLILIKNDPKGVYGLYVYFSLSQTNWNWYQPNPLRETKWTIAIVKNSFLNIKHVNGEYLIPASAGNPWEQFSLKLWWKEKNTFTSTGIYSVHPLFISVYFWKKSSVWLVKLKQILFMTFYFT